MRSVSTINNNIRLYFQTRALAVLLLGIASGIPLALTGSTLKIWLTEVGVNVTTIGLFSMVTIPYALKFLWAPLIDHFNIPYLSTKLGRRRSWMILSQLVLMMAIVTLGHSDPTENIHFTTLCAILTVICSATQDIIIDAYRIELMPKEEQGIGAAMAVNGYRIGMLLTGAGALYLSEYFDWFIVYCLSASLIVIGIITVLCLGEPKIQQSKQHSTNINNHSLNIADLLKKLIFSPLAEFLNRPSGLIIVLFIIFYKYSDTLVGTMTSTFFIQVGFSKSEIATIVKFWGFWASILGSIIGGIMVARINMLYNLWFGIIIQMLSNLMFVFQAIIGYDINILALTIGIENFAGGIGSTIFVAYLSMLCNISTYTATQYALLSALPRIGCDILSAPSGFIVAKAGWIPFFISTSLAALPSMILLYMLAKRLHKKL